MGEYRTPASKRWTPWIATLLLVAVLVCGFVWIPHLPLPGLLGLLFAFAGFSAYVLLRSWAAWRRRPTVIRVGQSQLVAWRGDASVIAEIPYAAIAAIEDRFWSSAILVRGADGLSRIEIPLATKGIRELLIALADRIPPYLWDLESGRRFAVPVNWTVMLICGLSHVAMAVCFYLAGWLWLAAACAAGAVLILATLPLRVHNYEISRSGCTIRRVVKSRFVAATEVASVQLKWGHSGAPLALYVSLMLHSGRRVALMNAEQSAVVLYRALLDMRKKAGGTQS